MTVAMATLGSASSRWTMSQRRVDNQHSDMWANLPRGGMFDWAAERVRGKCTCRRKFLSERGMLCYYKRRKLRRCISLKELSPFHPPFHVFCFALSMSAYRRRIRRRHSRMSSTTRETKTEPVLSNHRGRCPAACNLLRCEVFRCFFFVLALGKMTQRCALFVVDYWCVPIVGQNVSLSFSLSLRISKLSQL
jgi:hypothetical protein